MRQLIVLLVEFVLIIGLVLGIYYTNLSKKIDYLPYKYKKPLISTQLDLSDLKLKEELIFFLTKELGLYEGSFEILEVVYLYTSSLSGADYVLITLKTPDKRLCYITLSRNFMPGAKWELTPKIYTILEPLKPLIGLEVKVPKCLQNLGVTKEQLTKYYSAHPELALKGESAFFDEKKGTYSLPSDWHQTVFSLVTEKDRKMRLISSQKEKSKADLINFYWKVDYPKDYLGLGYREYLYERIKGYKKE